MICVALALTVGVYIKYNAKNQNNVTEEESSPEVVDDRRELLESKLKNAEDTIAKNVTDTDFAEEYTKKGEALYDLGRTIEAREAFMKTLEYDANSAGAYLNLSNLDADAGNMDAARQNIKKYVDTNSDSVSRWEKYIEFSKNRLGANGETLNGIYVEGLVATKNHIRMIVAYAKFLEEEGDNQLAKEFWQQAVVKDPENKAAYEEEIKKLQ